MKDLPTVFLGDYLKLLNMESLQPEGIIKTCIAEYLRKNQETLPVFLKQLGAKA